MQLLVFFLGGGGERQFPGLFHCLLMTKLRGSKLFITKTRYLSNSGTWFTFAPTSCHFSCWLLSLSSRFLLIQNTTGWMCGGAKLLTSWSENRSIKTRGQGQNKSSKAIWSMTCPPTSTCVLNNLFMMISQAMNVSTSKRSAFMIQ